MLERGETAPDFTLPGYCNDETGEYTLSEKTDEGNAVVIAFYPFDFNPVCEEEMCSINDAGWFTLTEGLVAWGISGDSVFAHRAFAEENGINFPLLSDHDGSVGRDYGVLYDSLNGHRATHRRSVFVVDSNREVRYAFSSEDPETLPDFEPVHETVVTLDETTV